MIWKIYFWLMAFLIVSSILAVGPTVTWEIHLVDWLNVLFMIVGLIGVFGYAFKHKIASKGYWLIFTIIAIAYQAAYSFVLDQKYGATPATSVADGLFTFVPLIPMFIALFLYVYRSRLLDK